jgi:predicted  nucleic acid-binding Zn-ribbon protein
MKEIIKNLLELQTMDFASAIGTATERRQAELRARIPAPILSHYDRLRARGKKGVAVIKGQVCAECHVQVPRNTVLILMHDTDIQICENCGRYLCLPEHAAPAQPPAKTRKSRATPPTARPHA